MKKLLSIFSAIVFFIGNVGFTISTHYCGGKIHKQSIGFVVDDLSCGMESSEEPPCKAKGDVYHNNCCQNQFQSFKVTDEFLTTMHAVKLDYHFVTAFVISCVELLPSVTENHFGYLIYHPPSLASDIPTLIQSFLI